MLWSLVQAMVMKMRFSILLRRKLFLGQNIGFSKKMTSTCELNKVVAALDNRDHYTFSNYQTVSKFALTVTYVSDQGLIEANIDNGIPCLGASNLGAQIN